MNTRAVKKKDSHTGIDMTVGNPMEKILKFSVPLLLGNILQQLYNTVDSIVVGQYIGSEALAAVGASGPVINLLVSFFLGISVGTGIVISQAFGAKDYDKLKSATGTVCTITVLTGLFLMAAGIPSSSLLLKLVNTPADIMEPSVTYMQITFAGVLFLMLFNMFNGISRAWETLSPPSSSWLSPAPLTSCWIWCSWPAWAGAWPEWPGRLCWPSSVRWRLPPSGWPDPPPPSISAAKI